MSLTEGAVYIDSPIPAAVRQVAPFYSKGVFSNSRTPMLLRKRIGTGFGLLAPSRIGSVEVRSVDGSVAKKLPVRKNGAIFYPFNGQGNLHTVANRSYRHVLVLHGESNKRASARPAARLYDYICVAGPIAVHRYLDAGIFRHDEVENGRVLMTGDTFIQDMSNCRISPESGDHILYAPTWEGYGGQLNDYSTIRSFGFQALREALEMTGRRKVVIRPHPYLGLLQPSMIREFHSGVVDLAKRYSVRIDLSDANVLVRTSFMAMGLSGKGDIGRTTGQEEVALCLCDVSAMESICLKENLPHFVLLRNFDPPGRISSFYAEKSAADLGQFRSRFPGYWNDPSSVDAPHRRETFDVSDPGFHNPDHSQRLSSMLDRFSKNEYWRSAAH